MSEVLSPGILRLDVSEKLVRLAELEAATSSLLHDVRGKLTTALLVADRLRTHFDPKVAKAGETVVTAIMQAEERLLAMRPSRAAPIAELRILRRASK